LDSHKGGGSVGVNGIREIIGVDFCVIGASKSSCRGRSLRGRGHIELHI
jgi:hypothetical protein